jgi:hypothetical protein
MSADSKVKADFFSYQGRSMWPVFQEGDLLEVHPVAFEELRVGDCITYRLQNCGTLVTHRVSAIHGENLVTRGDAFPWPDKLSVNASQLIGRVCGRFRMGSLKQVRGGMNGRLSGGFYHYAGRIDPQRDARGGRAARRLRESLRWLAAGLYRRGAVREFADVGRVNKCYWHVGQYPWASFDHTCNRWLVPWPQSLLIDPNRLPEQDQA